MLRTRLVALTVLTAVVLLATQVVEFGGGDDGGNGERAAATSSTTATTGPRPRPSSSTTSTTAPPCRPDGRSVRRDGVMVREFCGPARAVVHVGEEVYDFRGGTCRAHRRWWQLSIGVVVLANRPRLSLNPRFASFSMLVGRHPAAAAERMPAPDDGTYNEGDVSFTVPGAAYTMQDVTIILEEQRSRGSVAGTALRARQGEKQPPLPVRGRFNCRPSSPRALDRFRDEGPTTTEAG